MHVSHVLLHISSGLDTYAMSVLQGKETSGEGTTRNKKQKTEPEAVHLPPELVGRIVGFAKFPYDRMLMGEIRLNADEETYAVMVLREIEQSWEPLVEQVKGVLGRLKTHLIEREGKGNRLTSTSTSHVVHLISCWPRYWVFQEVDDADHLEEAILECDGSIMDRDMCRAASGTYEHSFTILEQHEKELTVFLPDDLHPSLKSAWLSFAEAFDDHFETYEGELNTLSRNFYLRMRFNTGDEYSICVSAEHHEYPDHFTISPAWVTTRRYGTDRRPSQEDKEEKGVLGPHGSTVALVLRMLLLMEPAPYMRFSSREIGANWARELRVMGCHRIGLTDLHVKRV